MGYRIDYDSMHRETKDSRRMVLTCLFFFLFLLGVGQFWPEGKRTLRGILLLGTESAGRAVRSLILQLENDIPVMNAVHTFCNQILSRSSYGTY